MDGWDEWMRVFFLDGNGNLKKKKSILYPPWMCCSFSFMKMCAYRFLFALPAFDRIFQRPPPLEIPMPTIQIPSFIIFRHTRLFTLFIPQPTAYVFHPPHGAEEVPAGEVGEIVFRPTAFD